MIYRIYIDENGKEDYITVICDYEREAIREARAYIAETGMDGKIKRVERVR